MNIQLVYQRLTRAGSLLQPAGLMGDYEQNPKKTPGAFIQLLTYLEVTCGEGTCSSVY